MGFDYFGSDAQNNTSIKGVYNILWVTVAALANDPIFLNHHAMVDRTASLKHGYKRIPMLSTYSADSDKIPPGHGYNNYIIMHCALFSNIVQLCLLLQMKHYCAKPSASCIHSYSWLASNTVSSVMHAMLCICTRSRVTTRMH